MTISHSGLPFLGHPVHVSFHGRTTVSVTEVSVLSAGVCETACHRTYDETWISRVSSI